jgi:hypothetical protein
MATHVNTAFAEFMGNVVNLDPDQTATARNSRDWLASHLRSFPEAFSDFPRDYDDMQVYFGSFHRRTKIRPLDDIDLMFCLLAEQSTYQSSGSTVTINVHPNANRLMALCHESTNELNSRKVLNQLVHRLSSISQYRRSDIGRNGEAVVLDLESYPWSFDIVPAFFTVPDGLGQTYYVIPDGQGNWKKTDPRIDQERIQRVNQAHEGHVLAALRLMKFWNLRPTKPTIESYVLESMILAHYEQSPSKAASYVDIEVAPILMTVASAVLRPIPDPKGIQGELNRLSSEQQLAISARALVDAQRANRAVEAEQSADHRASIQLWGEIFGPDFPTYG